MSGSRPPFAEAGLTGHTGSNGGDTIRDTRAVPAPTTVGADTVLYSLGSAGFTPSHPDTGPLALMCHALGDETRIRIVAWLSHGELCVCHLEKALGLRQPSVSRQLGVLRAAGIVASHRRGSWVYYSLAAQANAEAAMMLGALVKSFGEVSEARAEHATLRRSYGSEACA